MNGNRSLIQLVGLIQNLYNTIVKGLYIIMICPESAMTLSHQRKRQYYNHDKRDAVFVQCLMKNVAGRFNYRYMYRIDLLVKLEIIFY